jgi:GDP-4-dehydro-6-deoxy-D-mannose reductase
MGETILVTGAAGLVGTHLLDALSTSNARLISTYFKPTVRLEELEGKGEVVQLDVTDGQAVRDTISRWSPSTVFHLAAQSLPAVSWLKPHETMTVNALGTINLFEAIKAKRSTDPNYDPCVVVACSSAEYGASLIPERVPISEDAPLLPLHPYGVSKVAQDLLTFQYWVNDRIRGIRARIFNTTGPRKQNDVVSDFAARAARVRLQGGALAVGNLKTRRAILDVRDLVAALVRLSYKGRAGEAYNISADTAYQVGDLIPMLEKAAGMKFDIEVDPKLFRPSDEPIIFGSAEKLKQETGWAPSIPIEKTVADVYEYEIWRVNGFPKAALRGNGPR